MINVGTFPYLECSTRGDSRFSAFHARIKEREDKSIEEIYQAAKIFEGGVTNLSWREAKGRKAVNQRAVSTFYGVLWNEYILENPKLLKDLRQASGLSDIFGQPKRCCQALELWRIRNDYQTFPVWLYENAF